MLENKEHIGKVQIRSGKQITESTDKNGEMHQR